MPKGMVFLNTKELIKNKAEEIGIDVIGFTSCEPFTGLMEILKERETLGYLSGFEEKDMEKRVNPGLAMEGCRTIIAGAISYNVDKTFIKQKDNYTHKSFISKSAWGIDYHHVLKSKLNELAKFIEVELHGNTKVYVDTGPLVDREVARRSGIGYMGKNCSIINKEYGSYIFIGEILTDIYVEPDKPVEDGCGSCDLCLKACPTGALCRPYTINAKKCISYLTQSKEFDFERHMKIGSSIYGCDVCQNACPKNRDAGISRHMEFLPEPWNAYPDAVDILYMDNKTFEKTYKGTSSGWRGKKNLQRNAIIALGNSKNKDNAQYIKDMLKDSRKDIRKVSIYALYNLLGRHSLPLLREHFQKEKDEELREIINKFINKD